MIECLWISWRTHCGQAWQIYTLRYQWASRQKTWQRNTRSHARTVTSTPIGHSRGGRRVSVSTSGCASVHHISTDTHLSLFLSNAAQEAGVYNAEIAPIDVKAKKGKVAMTQDEHPRPQTTLEQMAKLPPVFKKGGTVTAANASVGLTVTELELVLKLWKVCEH